MVEQTLEQEKTAAGFGQDSPIASNKTRASKE